MGISYLHRPWKTLRVKQGYPTAFLFTQDSLKQQLWSFAVQNCSGYDVRRQKTSMTDPCLSVLHPSLHHVCFLPFLLTDWLPAMPVLVFFPDGKHASPGCTHLQEAASLLPHFPQNWNKGHETKLHYNHKYTWSTEKCGAKLAWQAACRSLGVKEHQF